jgi:hypothetical protein
MAVYVGMETIFSGMSFTAVTATRTTGSTKEPRAPRLHPLAEFGATQDAAVLA